VAVFTTRCIELTLAAVQLAISESYASTTVHRAGVAAVDQKLCPVTQFDSDERHRMPNADLLFVDVTEWVTGVERMRPSATSLCDARCRLRGQASATRHRRRRTCGQTGPH
jgi:hypothetical protein